MLLDVLIHLAHTDIQSVLLSEREIEINVQGRVSGKIYRLSMWFVYEGGRIYLLPIKGSDSNWFKNIRNNPSVRIIVSGEPINVVAKPLTEPRIVKQVVGNFNRKYGADEVETWYSKFDAAVELPLMNMASTVHFSESINESLV